MAGINYRVLGQVNPTNGANTVLYTVPNNYSTRVTTLAVCNYSNAATRFSIAVQPSNATIAANSYLNYNTWAPAYDTTLLHTGVSLNDSDVISVVTNGSSNVSYTLFGFETSKDMPTLSSVEYLVIAGGGGGGDGPGGYGGGGGGAGGFRTGNTQIQTNANLVVVIGAGGTNSTNGSNSYILGGNPAAGYVINLISVGGGRGASYSGSVIPAGSGGSGGGGTNLNGDAGGTGIAGQGFAGGQGGGQATYYNNGGGGGGASAVGTGGSYDGTGGAGAYSAITGTNIAYAGGGGGGTNWGPSTGGRVSYGGVGGGGQGTAYGTFSQNPPTAGTTNTGSGGGGGGSGTTGGYGGSGIVIVRYPTYYSAATTTGSPNVTISGGYRIYRFWQTGSIYFNK